MAVPASGARVRLSDIAEEAGVSVALVSKVLNGRADVAPTTRRKVEDLLAKYSYRPRRAPARASTHLVDLVINELDSAWSLEIVEGVAKVAQDNDAATVVSVLSGGEEHEVQRWLRNLTHRRSDGVVLVVSQLSRRHLARLARLGVPVVAVDPAGEPDEELPTIGATNWSGGFAAAEHLVGLGHRRIAVITGPQDVLCSRARLDGFRAALDRAGVDLPASMLRHGAFTTESGERWGSDLLAHRDAPTAIFCGSDQQAFGVYAAARRRGLSVPADLSVVGFDGLPATTWVTPPLTTVRQPLRDVAGLATEMLLQLIRGQALQSRRVELATSLVVRESTCPPRDVRA
ncbi:MAG: LacI family DNA-binding transcriptional regulator [Kineosporiaceae bacterium]